MSRHWLPVESGQWRSTMDFAGALRGNGGLREALRELTRALSMCYEELTSEAEPAAHACVADGMETL